MIEYRRVLVLSVVIIVALAGCQKAEPTPVAGAGTGFTGPEPGPAGSLTGVNGLALGTLKLEGTEDAVTPAQAAELLPLWQVIQSGSLQGDAETDAVLKQIEAKLTESQRAAIDGMALKMEDMQAWMQEHGIEMPAQPDAGGQGGPGALQNLSEDERAQMREQFQNMSAEERATRTAEMGFQRPEGTPGALPQGQIPGGAGRNNFLLRPLIELLTQRAAE